LVVPKWVNFETRRSKGCSLLPCPCGLGFGGMGSAMLQMFGDSFLSLNSRRFDERL
jgi:hypothetical protein